MPNHTFRVLPALACTVALVLSAGCGQPDDSPFKQESETLRKQLAKQESVVASLQEGNKVMQQQIDLLNQELRDAKQEREKALADQKAAEDERNAMAKKLDLQLTRTKNLTVEVQRTATRAAAMVDNIRIEEKGSQEEDIPRPIAVVTKAAEEALARNGYHVRVSVKTDQKAVLVTDRKISNPSTLEVSGFRNQYILSLKALPANVTHLSVKADIEKLAQGGKVLTVSAEETAEIERRLIGEISKAVAQGKKS